MRWVLQFKTKKILSSINLITVGIQDLAKIQCILPLLKGLLDLNCQKIIWLATTMFRSMDLIIGSVEKKISRMIPPFNGTHSFTKALPPSIAIYIIWLLLKCPQIWSQQRCSWYKPWQTILVFLKLSILCRQPVWCFSSSSTKV